MKERERLPELLVPAGGREQLESAILYGADAVYMGGPELSLRTACEGFSGEELGLAVADAHTAGVRVYYCLNAMPYDAQLPAVEAVLERLPGMGVDGLIAADPGVIWLAKKHCPSVPLHLSTQAHSVNGAAVAFWREAGVERINLARELGFKQIRALAEAFPGVDFEVFVHGAMCLALSGHCLLSAWVNNRPANQGRCTQPCRFEYRGLSLLVEEQKRSGDALWEIREGEAFSGFWAPQDLCLLRYVGCLADLGVRALKLEGRTKSGGYVAQIADVYRTALIGTRAAKREVPTAERWRFPRRRCSKNCFIRRHALCPRAFSFPAEGWRLPRPVCSPGPWWRGLRNRRETAGGCRCVPRGHRIVKRPFSCRGCGVRHFSPARIGLKTTGESAWISCTPAWRACCIAKSTASERGCT